MRSSIYQNLCQNIVKLALYSLCNSNNLSKLHNVFLCNNWEKSHFWCALLILNIYFQIFQFRSSNYKSFKCVKGKICTVPMFKLWWSITVKSNQHKDTYSSLTTNCLQQAGLRFRDWFVSAMVIDGHQNNIIAYSHHTYLKHAVENIVSYWNL